MFELGSNYATSRAPLVHFATGFALELLLIYLAHNASADTSKIVLATIGLDADNDLLLWAHLKFLAETLPAMV